MHTELGDFKKKKSTIKFKQARKILFKIITIGKRPELSLSSGEVLRAEVGGSWPTCVC